MMDRRLFSGWAHVSRAEDVAGCWVSYCPEFDIMSQGDSPLHAREMLREAMALALADDLDNGLDPHDRRADDDESWEGLFRIFNKHETVQIKELDDVAERFTEFAFMVTVELVRAAAGVNDNALELAPRNVDALDAKAA